MTDFTHLTVASAFSAHHGTSSPEALVEAAAADGARIAAITDRDGLYGAVRHIRACIAHGLDPVVGVNLQLKDRRSSQITAAAEATAPAKITAPAKNTAPAEITVLAHGHNHGAGWAGLVRLISSAHAPKRGARRIPHGTAHRPAWITRSQPAAFIQDDDGAPTATVLLGAHSDVGRAVLIGQREQALGLLQDWCQRLPGGVVVDIVCHHTKPGLPGSLRHAAQMLQLAVAAGVPAVLSNAVRYKTQDEAATGDVLDAAAHLLPLGKFAAQPNAQAWLKPAELMHRLAQQIVEAAGLRPTAAYDLLDQTQRLAQRCRLDPQTDLRWRQPKVPELDVLGLHNGAGLTPDEILIQRCQAALDQRYPHASGLQLSELEQRLSDELGTIRQFGFSTYFLTVADVVDMIRQRRIRVQARGSGAGSLVNYLLQISTVDPMEHGLLFERFLGKKRSTLPDIDVDIESARRHEVYEAIFERYGHHRVTLLSMQNRYRARGAARDAGLALGLTEERIDQIAQNLWRFNAREFRQVLSSKPELREVAELVRAEPEVDLLVDLTERLDRLPRHISMHPCGVILGDADLLSLTPTQPSGIGLPMSQFDKDDIDDMGLLKLDVLGVRMQSTMAYAVKEIQRVNGAQAAEEGGLPSDAPYISAEGEVDLDALPKDDETTFAAIRTTHTLGMFQIESPGQRELVGKLQPDAYSDLIADISLFRPGPMKGNMVTPFVERKHGFEDIRYLHPRFAPFLQDSYGVVIYHEHVLRILSDVMGISLAEADELRRRLEKDAEQIEEQFRRRAAENKDAGVPRFSSAEIDRIWEALKGFGSFGFCKAHGAAFALPTYQSAWLKAHYPVEFLAGIFEHDPGMYPRRLLMAEARRIGIPLLPVDVNVSSAQYRVERTNAEEKGIRLSLRDIRGITEAECERIVQGQPYHSIADFWRRAAPSRPLMVRLASIGALDSLAADHEQRTSRGGLIAYVRQLTAAPKKPRSARVDGPVDSAGSQPALFAEHALFSTKEPEPSAEERISAELDVLSSEVSGHVMQTYQPLLDELGVTPASQLLDLRNHSQVLVAGIRVATQTPPMRSGKRTVFISLDDGTGCADTAFFEEAQQQAGPLLFGTKLMVIRGKTRRTGDRGVSIQADGAWDLKQLWAQWQQTHQVDLLQESETQLA